jgi:hypothetical protein
MRTTKMTKSMMPLLKGGESGSSESMCISECVGGGMNTKLVELPKTLGVTVSRASPNHSLGATILDRTRIKFKDK